MNKELLSLSEQRLHQLKSILVDAGLRSEQISIDKESVDEYPITATIRWGFNANASSGSHAVTPPTGSRQVRDTNDLSNAIQKEQNRLEQDYQAHKHFLHSVLSLDKVKPIHTVSPPSTYHTYEKCNSCSGKGNTTCLSCHGSKKRPCTDCNAQGRVRTGEPYSTNEYSQCTRCWGQGTVQCSHCQGNGTHQCSNCSGKGSTLTYRQVTLMATSSWSVSIAPFFPQHQLINQYLTNIGPIQTSVLADSLKLAELENHTGGLHDAHYAGKLTVSTIRVNLPIDHASQAYTIIYLGHQVEPIDPPKLLDDLLRNKIDELSQLHKNLNTTASTQQLFSKITSIELMNQAIKKIASFKSPTEKDTQQAITNLTHGYLSDDTATTLSLIFHDCLKKISPVYSKLTWTVVTLLLSIIVYGISTRNLPSPDFLYIFLSFLNLEYLYRLIPPSLFFTFSILYILIDTLVLLTISLVIIIPLSMILRQISLRKLPKAYRLPAKHLKPFKYVALILCGVALLSIFIDYFR